MSYLRDANVISELRKGECADPGVAAWLADLDDEEIFLLPDEGRRRRCLQPIRHLSLPWDRSVGSGRASARLA
ncbi:MAG: hypothetical protein JSS97_08795 [Actinobacteria bacterium]|nr:hypothetical protein [Actinomycetota bacterium]